MGTIPSELVEHIPSPGLSPTFLGILSVRLHCVATCAIFPIKRHLLLHGSQVPIVAHCELMKQVARVVREPRRRRRVERNLDPRKIDA